MSGMTQVIGLFQRVAKRWSKARLYVATLLSLLTILAPHPVAAQNSVAFESGQVRPLLLSSAGDRLYAANTPAGRIEIYSVSAAGLVPTGSVPVGLEPVALAMRGDGELWVVNHLSDSVSVVDVRSVPARVVRTLQVGDEPRDIVFAGITRERAFITTAHRGQNSPWTDPANPGQMTTPGVGRADVWVFDSNNLGSDPGGNALSVLTLFTDTPRALAVSADGTIVYAAGFHSGNQTTVVPEGAVCNGGSAAVSCTVDALGSAPGGLPAPNADAAGVRGPETGLIVRFDGSHWLDQLARIWDPVVRFNLPDRDVFAIDALATPPRQTRSWASVGTILYNMAVNPVSGKVYVTNTEARNERRLEGPREPGSTVATVQGRLHQSQITVLDGSAVLPRHLNKHIDYDQRPAPAGVAERSLAQPQDMAISSDGNTLYVAAFGSSKIGIFDTASLEDNSFVPNAQRQIIVNGGGPAGLALDEARNKLYVLTRFDNSVRVIDLGRLEETQASTMLNPEPADVVAGRRFLYDARFSSSNGEASCGSCHVFGDFDSLAWDLGNPAEVQLANLNPGRNFTNGGSFHPLKGPMTTQSLRGMANHGAMHWRGDRTGSNDAANAQPDSGAFDERAAFAKFSGAFVGLLGRTAEPTAAEMNAFTSFALKLAYPPNPIRRLDNGLTPMQQAGRDLYFGQNTDASGNCNVCHRLDTAAGQFGTDGFSSLDGVPQIFKVPHLRNMYQKVGMFGAPTIANFNSTDNAHTGDQIAGFGYQFDGSVDTLFRFLQGRVFTFPDATKQREVEQFLLAFDSNLAPVVGQQVTVSPSTIGNASARINLLEARAAAGECEVVAKAVVNGRSRGYQRLANGNYTSDLSSDASLTPTELRDLVSTAQTELTYSCVPVGSGRRIGIDGDCDDLLDGDDASPDVPANGRGCGVAPTVPAPVFTLTASPASITTGSTSTLTWSAATNASSCVAVGGWAANPSIAGGTQTVAPSATTTYTLTCMGSGGSSSRSTTVTVTAATAVAPKVTLSASPTTLTVGQSSTLTWSSTDTTSCTASGAWSGSKALGGSEAVSPTTTGVQTYTLSCSGPGGTASASRQVTVNAAKPVVTLTVSPSSITTGQSSTLNWSSTNATACTASGAWSGAQPISGSQVVTPASPATYTYTLTCTGQGGSGAKSVSLKVSAPKPVVTMTFSPTSITTAQSSTLNWSSTNATACTASGAWSGPQAVSGSLVVSPATPGTYSYTLTCNGVGGSAAKSVSLKVSAPKPTIAISVSPASITTDQSSTLTWSSTNATSCTASGAWSGPQATSGNTVVRQSARGTFIYTLSCSGPGGNISSSARLTVTAGKPTLQMSVSPATVRVNEVATLSWTTTIASSCTASGAWSGSRAVNGNLPVQQAKPGSYTYTLDCSASTGTVRQSAILQVDAALPVVQLSVQPSSITVGDSSTLQWTVTNADSCVASGDWDGSKPVSGSAVVAPETDGDYRYTLNCTGAGGSSDATTQLQVIPAPP